MFVPLVVDAILITPSYYDILLYADLGVFVMTTRWLIRYSVTLFPQARRIGIVAWAWGSRDFVKVQNADWANPPVVEEDASPALIRPPLCRSYQRPTQHTASQLHTQQAECSYNRPIIPLDLKTHWVCAEFDFSSHTVSGWNSSLDPTTKIDVAERFGSYVDPVFSPTEGDSGNISNSFGHAEC